MTSPSDRAWEIEQQVARAERIVAELRLEDGELDGLSEYDAEQLDRFMSAFGADVVGPVLALRRAAMARRDYYTEASSRLAARAYTTERVIAHLELLIDRAMRAAGVTRCDTDHGTCTLASTPGRVQGPEDVDQWPEQFVRVTESRKPDRAAMLAALKAGQSFDGFDLVKEQRLRIK